MKTIEELEQKLTEPSDALVKAVQELDEDIMILGVGGKMGPTLAKLAKNALDQAGLKKRIIGVSRFSEAELKRNLEAYGIETITANLMDPQQLEQLPEVKNIIFMVGYKFGTTGKEHLAWAVNSYLPGQIAARFKNSRIVSFSTGNVYPFSRISSGGVSEEKMPEPIGEYAQSCLGRERVFNYFSDQYQIPVLHFRLNYAIDMRYGVLLEIAKAVQNKQPINLKMGHVNVIWQGDANERALRSLPLCDTPPRILNITGPETVSVRWLAQQFADRLGVTPEFAGEEQDTALLSNASKSQQLFGYPSVTLGEMIDWTANWVKSNGETIDKPTHFQERKGAF